MKEKPRLISLHTNTNEHFQKQDGVTYLSFAQDLPNGKTKWFRGSIDSSELLRLLKPHLKEGVE